MRCRNCHGEIPDNDIHANTASHDEGLLDIIAECPTCDAVFNDFVDIYGMSRVDEEEEDPSHDV